MSADIGYVQLKISELQDKNKILENSIDELKIKYEKVYNSVDKMSSNIDALLLASSKLSDIEVLKKDIITQSTTAIKEIILPKFNEYIDKQMQRVFDESGMKEMMDDVLMSNKTSIEAEIKNFEKLYNYQLQEIVSALNTINLKGNFGVPIKKKKDYIDGVLK